MTFWDQLASPRFWISASLMFGVVAVYSLIALWAATSSRPRLVRALVVWIAIVLLIPVRAYDAALLLTMNAVLTAVLVALVGRCLNRHTAVLPTTSPDLPVQPPHARFQFQCADAFILTLLVATCLALGSFLGIYHPLLYPVVLLYALPLSATTTFAYFLATGPRRWTMLLLLMGSALFFAGRMRFF